MQKKLFLFFILAVTCSFAYGSDWDQYFKDQKDIVFDLELAPHKVLVLRPPPGFKYDYSLETEKGLLFEFVPEEESVGNWTQMYSIIIFPYPVRDFQNFVREYAGPRFPVYFESLKFQQDDGIDNYCWGFETSAIKMPECERIEGLNELTLKIGFQGDKGFYTFGCSIRYDENEAKEQRMKRAKALFDLVQNSFDIIDY